MSSNTKWTPGPLAAYGEHMSEHGKFVYAVRETQPMGQIAGYPTPTARYRNRADALIGALAPEMAAAILAMDDEGREMAGKNYGPLLAGVDRIVYDLAQRLRLIGADE